jgi:hypothetical protein
MYFEYMHVESFPHAHFGFHSCCLQNLIRLYARLVQSPLLITQRNGCFRNWISFLLSSYTSSNSAAGWTALGDSKRFSSSPNGQISSFAHKVSYWMGTRVSFSWSRCPWLQADASPPSISKLRMSRSAPPLPLTPSWFDKGHHLSGKMGSTGDFLLWIREWTTFRFHKKQEITWMTEQ